MNFHTLFVKTMHVQFFVFLFCVLFLLSGCAPHIPHTTQAPLFPDANYTLTVMHTNDAHSSYGGITDKGMSCYGALCEGGRGGYVRLDQAVRAIRQNSPDAVLLDGGDIFQGTLFWIQHKEHMPMALIDKLGYQAIVPGNHEFDDGWGTWLRLVEGIKTPVLAANVVFDPRPDSPGLDKISPYIIIERQGHKIGIVGLITEDVPTTSTPGPGVNFLSAQAALHKAVAELTNQDVRIIIAVTHLGLENDRLLARAVDGVDIIVGAHSHSLLSNYNKKAEAPYPVVEKTPDGTTALIVTASTACIYLGYLDVGFDSLGVAREWRGRPILLDQANLDTLHAPAPNPELVQIIEDFAVPVKKMMQTSIGSINAAGKEGLPLEEPNVMECRKKECLTGYVAADALRTIPFPDAQIAILNAGSLRVSLPGGVVTPGNVLGTLPFQNTPVITSMPGEILWQALEHGVAKYGEGEGGFLQVSGLRYAFTPSLAPGSRITRVEYQTPDGRWQTLDRQSAYRVVTVDFIAKGGDGFAMLKSLSWTEGSKLVNDSLRMYIEQHSPIELQWEDRIVIEQ
ncbi:5'-nucleotidase C-terminal domain-containing protein [Desulfovibrionales bacterium]